VSFQGGFDGSEPVVGEGVATGRHEHRRAARSSRLGTGTLACPVCDAPVFGAGPLSPADRLDCPFCRHAAAVRDFLSLAAPARPARVVVRVVSR
jgi:hypothetical protein